MITERTVKVGEQHFLEYIDDSTGGRIKQIPLDESEYNCKTVEILTEGHMKKNQGVTYSEALLAVSKEHPDLFKIKETQDKSSAIIDKVRNDLINEFMDQNKDVSYKEAVFAVSKKRPDLFTMEARTWQ